MLGEGIKNNIKVTPRFEQHNWKGLKGTFFFFFKHCSRYLQNTHWKTRSRKRIGVWDEGKSNSLVAEQLVGKEGNNWCEKPMWSTEFILDKLFTITCTMILSLLFFINPWHSLHYLTSFILVFLLLKHENVLTDYVVSSASREMSTIF